MTTELCRRGDVSSPTSLETPSGIFVELLAPHPDDILLFDIAHNLSNECRYGGSCNLHFSVAEHAVMVARELRRREAHPVTVLRGLHHDDAEAYLKDLPAPLKRTIEQLAPGVYAHLTGLFDGAIAAALGLHVDCGDGEKMVGSEVEVKDVDEWALGIEAVTMLPSKGRGWVPRERIPGPDQLLDAHRTVGQVFARMMFLEEHERCLVDARAAVIG